MAACLRAFRHAISQGTPVVSPPVFDYSKSVLTIGGVEYAASAPTGFVYGKNTMYDLAALVVFWEFGRPSFEAGRDINLQEYLKHCTEQRKCKFVTPMDVGLVRDYLRGLSEASGRVVEVQEGMGAAAVKEGPLADEESRWTLESAMAHEMLVVSRRAVLDCGRNLRNEVYELFDKSPAPAAAAASASASSSSSSSSSSAAAAAGGSKRPAEAAGGGSKRSRAEPGSKLDTILANFKGTPIILVPNSSSNVISLYNAKQLLEGGEYVSTEEAKAAHSGEKPVKVEINRKDAHGNSLKYYVMDDPTLLSREDWLIRVLAVFAAGPEWQFKGWKWGEVGRGEKEPDDVLPVKIFSKSECVGLQGGGQLARAPPPPTPAAQHSHSCTLLTPTPTPPHPHPLATAALGFHLHFEGDPPHENASQWAVKCIPVSKTQRFLDSSVARRFWSVVDEDVHARRPWLGGRK